MSDKQDDYIRTVGELRDFVDREFPRAFAREFTKALVRRRMVVPTGVLHETLRAELSDAVAGRVLTALESAIEQSDRDTLGKTNRRSYDGG